MGIFSWFGAGEEESEGSYCETSSKTHFNFFRGGNIDEEISKAEDRGDSVDFGDKDFHDNAVNRRHDDDGRDVEEGPSRPWWR